MSAYEYGMTLTPEIRSQIVARLEGCFLGEPHTPTLPGGRTEALRRLQSYDVTAYGRSRNHLDGAVSQLSPYLRHGMLSLVEVRNHVRQRYTSQPELIEEFQRQLAWRDFFEKVLAWHGRGLEEDLEEPKHAAERTSRMPLDVLKGDTGLPCVDAWLHELFTEGYLHNHTRLWFAAYLCHFRGVRWQLGAKLFRQYLYDGDLASNSSSWQWVESTFASKPYFMNKENIRTFSNDRWCRDCRAKCPFDASYPTLQQRLFENRGRTELPEKQVESRSPEMGAPFRIPVASGSSSDLVWLHDAALSFDNPVLQANPNAAVTFVFDEVSLCVEPWAYHRLAFVLDGVADVFEHVPNVSQSIRVGDLVQELLQEAALVGATTIHVTEHPNTWVAETIEELRKQIRVQVHARPVFAAYTEEPRRFSRYWERVSEQVLGYRAKPKHRQHK